MFNYVSLHVRTIWNDAHWRLVGVEETDDGDQVTHLIVGGVFPVPGAPEDRLDLASALTRIAVDLAQSQRAQDGRTRLSPDDS
jgi:hypothetical protein